ncbi:MAG: hypothetical protein KME16_02225 [Scytolyngbya sp. HA4215-MV1]|jgi:hypothetical protein|nr:hypothetical protein [Scytolyngbya sp. HA4215-MV1]
MGNSAPTLRQTSISVLALVLLFSFYRLFHDNMGTGNQNEGDVLPLARHFVDPSWIAGDWYLNQPAGYRFLFQAIAGKLILGIGFFATSIVGRLLGYSLIAWGMTRISQRLGLRLPTLLLSVCVWLFICGQRLVAREWMIGGFEAKVLAYGCIVLAISFFLENRDRWTAALLGCATSFHVLVGGWSFLAIVGCWGLRWKARSIPLSEGAKILALYGITASFGIQAVLTQLFTPAPPSLLSPSYIYVFLRLPHHLNPQSWGYQWRIWFMLYLLLLLGRVWQLRSTDPAVLGEEFNSAQQRLAEFAAMSVVPFLLGVAIAPFDAQGSLLQYYPFRLADVILPMSTCLLMGCGLQQAFVKRPRNWTIACILIVSLIGSFSFSTFQKQLTGFLQFSGAEQRISPEEKQLYAWIRTHTPKDAVLVSPPADMYGLTWMAERPTIAKYKFLPQGKAGILTWYERLSDLAGSTAAWSRGGRLTDGRDEIRDELAIGYNHLTTAQAKALMQKYAAHYFVAQVEQTLDLPMAYRNARYVLYGR